MATPMVKLKPHTHRSLQDISREDGVPMGDIIGYLVDRYERERFWRGAEADLARVREDAAAWDSLQQESRAWDATTADGLQREAPYYDADTDQ